MLKVVVLYLVMSCTVHVGLTGENNRGSNMPCCDENTLSVDLTSGGISGTPGAFGASVVSSFTRGSDCDSQGVLKVTFDKPSRNERQCEVTCNRHMLKVDMTLHSEVRDDWLFNFGNSPTNNGYAGDGASNSYDSEMQGMNNNMAVYKNDACGSGVYAQYPNAINSTVTSVSVKIASGYYEITNLRSLDVRECNGNCLFDLSGKADREKGGPNDFDIYLAFNRVVDGSYRNGKGVCRVQLSWECTLPPKGNGTVTYEPVGNGNVTYQPEGNETVTYQPVSNVTDVTTQPAVNANVPCCDENTLSVDLTSGGISGSPGAFGASVVSSFTRGSDCDSQGVLKVTFDKPSRNERHCQATCNRHMLKIDMTLHSEVREDWLFNFGNSRTNNGAAGDGATNTYDSEMEGRNNNMAVYNNDACGSGVYAQYPNAINFTVTSVSVKIASGYYEITNLRSLDVRECNGTCLFDLSGKADREKGGPNDFDIYLAFNRVVDGSYRNGKGVCRVQLSWECPLQSVGHGNDVRAESSLILFFAHLVVWFYI